MKQLKFDPIAALTSGLCGLAGAFLMSLQTRALDGSEAHRALWMGAFFLVVYLCGFAGLHIYLMLNPRYRVRRKKLWPVTALVCGVLIFGIGAGGQYLYMHSEEEIVNTVVTGSDVDMVLMMDGSSSMETNGYLASRNDAASSFVDSLGSDSHLQAAVFAGRDTVMGATELLPMDDAGKATIQDFISQVDCVGTTNFETALADPLNTLTTNPNLRSNSNKAVIVLTDGDTGILYSDFTDSYLDAGIKLFTVRITSGLYVSGEVQRLIDLANATGGFDTVLTPDANGNVDTTALLEAFQNAFQASSNTTVTRVSHTTDNLLIGTEPVSFGLGLLRTAVLMILLALFGLGYFGGVSLPSIGINAALGLALSLLAGLVGLGSLTLCAIVAGLLTAPAFVCYELAGGAGIRV